MSIHLADGDVIALQHFLLDAAKRYVVPGPGGLDAAGDLLAGAASLDYVLVLSRERAGGTLDEGSPIASGVRETLARAANAALDFLATMAGATPKTYADFAARHLGAGGIFDVLRTMRERGVLTDDDVAFRALTISNDLRDRSR